MALGGGTERLSPQNRCNRQILRASPASPDATVDRQISAGLRFQGDWFQPHRGARRSQKRESLPTPVNHRHSWVEAMLEILRSFSDDQLACLGCVAALAAAGLAAQLSYAFGPLRKQAGNRVQPAIDRELPPAVFRSHDRAA
jgi:hypothetical protein